MLLRVRVNPRKTGRNNTGTDTEHWEATPWNYFRSSADHSVPSSATRTTTWFRGTIPSRPPRENILFRGEIYIRLRFGLPWKPELFSKKKKERKKERNLYFNKLQGVCKRLCSIVEEVFPEIFCHCSMQEYFVRISNFTLISHNFLHRRSLKFSSAGFVRKSDMS